MQSVSKAYLDKLASLRFFAAFMVVIYHYGLFGASYENIFSRIYEAGFTYGYVGVCIFFVLSGFVISHANDKWKGWKVYLAGRVTRIYPSHWIVTFTLVLPAIIILFDKYGPVRDVWLSIMSNLTLVQAWNPQRFYFLSLNIVTWSLSVEIFFYVCFIFLRQLQSKYIYGLSFFSYLIILGCTIYTHQRWTPEIYWALYINPIARLPEFITGMAIYRLYKEHGIPELWLPRVNFLLLLVIMLTTLYTVGTYSKIGGGFKESFDYVVVPLPFVVLIILALLDESSNAYMHNKTLILLGESSFALYLIHKPIGSYIKHAIDANFHGNDFISIIFLLITISLSLGISIIFYRYIEMPITQRLKSAVLAKVS